MAFGTANPWTNTIQQEKQAKEQHSTNVKTFYELIKEHKEEKEEVETPLDLVISQEEEPLEEIEVPALITFSHHEEEQQRAADLDLNRTMGSIFANVPKEILAVKRCPDTDQILYLCRWEQSFSGALYQQINGEFDANCYFLPSWVQSCMLEVTGKDCLIKQFFEKNLPTF